MGRWIICLCIVVIMTCTDGATEITTEENQPKNGRQGKALHISRKPCSDPSGTKGLCTFKWDCISQNGTPMGTCADGFIFGTCCFFSIKNSSHFDGNSIDSFENSIVADASEDTKKKTNLPKTSTTRPTKRPVVFSEVTSTRSPQHLVTWTKIGPTIKTTPTSTRRPTKSPTFPFQPVPNYPQYQFGTWPVGVAVPVHNYAPYRPVQFQPPFPSISHYTSTPKIQYLQKPTPSASFTILNGADKNSTVSSPMRSNSTTSKDAIERTTIAVPIPQWSVPSNEPITNSQNGPGGVNILSYNKNNHSIQFGLTSTNTSQTSVHISSNKETTSLPLKQKLQTVKPTTAKPQSNQKKKFWDYRKDCGVAGLFPKARIVGGQSVSFGKWPWQVLVKEAAWFGLYQKNKCGGVLISARHVITAGHCQPGFLSSLVVILGEHDISSNLDMLKPEMRRVKRMIVHRQYNPQNFDNDIAILELEPPITFLPHISPICLPQINEDFTGKMGYVTGWGKLVHGGAIPNILQEVQVPIISNLKCLEMFQAAGHAKLIKDTFLCAGYQTGGKDSCEGDSGGPLMVQKDDGRWTLAGTVSHGIRCADRNLPGVYMRISAYRPWIDKLIGPINNF